MRIHLENQAKLQAMSQAEIQQEQRKLLSQLGKQRRGQKTKILSVFLFFLFMAGF